MHHIGEQYESVSSGTGGHLSYTHSLSSFFYPVYQCTITGAYILSDIIWVVNSQHSSSTDMVMYGDDNTATDTKA